jgi:hypothetical protein
MSFSSSSPKNAPSLPASTSVTPEGLPKSLAAFAISLLAPTPTETSSPVCARTWRFRCRATAPTQRPASGSIVRRPGKTAQRSERR